MDTFPKEARPKCLRLTLLGFAKTFTEASRPHAFEIKSAVRALNVKSLTDELLSLVPVVVQLIKWRSSPKLLIARKTASCQGLLMTDVDVLRQQVTALKWYHQIDLGHGIITPGVDNSPKKLARLHVPERLDGKDVLDIGAWDGFFSFEAERRGAKRVLATDSFVWNGQTWGSKQGFLLARKVFNSSVEDMHIDILDMAPEKVGTFDVVLFGGVLYHMKHPLLALEKLASVTRPGGIAIIETVCGCLWSRKPLIPFYPNAEMYNDSSNWCAPNPAATIALLKVAGFREVKIIAGVRSIFFRFVKACYYKAKWGTSFSNLLSTDRFVAHAVK